MVMVRKSLYTLRPGSWHVDRDQRDRAIMTLLRSGGMMRNW
jgi:hypothetical protein